MPWGRAGLVDVNPGAGLGSGAGWEEGLCTGVLGFGKY